MNIWRLISQYCNRFLFSPIATYLQLFFAQCYFVLDCPALKHTHSDPSRPQSPKNHQTVQLPKDEAILLYDDPLICNSIIGEFVRVSKINYFCGISRSDLLFDIEQLHLTKQIVQGAIRAQLVWGHQLSFLAHLMGNPAPFLFVPQVLYSFYPC